jgi:lipocalin-like protein
MRPRIVFTAFIVAATMLVGLAVAQQQEGISPHPARDQEKLLGNWKLVSFYTEDVQTKQRNDVYGARPIGYAALTPSGRLFAVITADGRKSPNSPEEQAAAFRSMIAYTGKFRIEGEKFITKVDAAWNEAWVGTEQARFWKVEGDRLHIISAPIPNPNVPNGLMIGVLVWEKE